MKFILSLILLVGITIAVNAQKSVYEYLAAIPYVPGAPCELDDAAPKDFKANIAKVLDEMSKDIAARKKKADNYMKDHETEARETALKNSGLVLTPAQMKIMQQENKHMTQAQKDELANNVMKQNMDVSMKQIDNLRVKKGSNKVDSVKAARWGEAYSTQVSAEREINPGKFEAREMKAKSMRDLAKQIDSISKILNAGENKYTERLNDLQDLADSLYLIMLTHTDPMHAEIDTINARLARDKAACNCDLEEASKKVFARTNFLFDEIQTLEYMYCLPLTPTYIDIVKDYRAYIETIFDECNMLEELQAEMHYRQTGIKDPMFHPGLMALEVVHHYAELVSNVYQYKMSDKPTQSTEE